MSCRTNTILLLAAMILASHAVSLAQGFDWEYSARLPVYAATIYVGPFASYQRIDNTTDVQVLEQIRQIQPAFLCVQYDKGSGSSYSGGVRGEWWKKSTVAFSANLCFQARNAQFSADPPPARLIDGNFLQTRYLLSTSFNSLCVEAQCKLRLVNSHVWAAVGLQSSLLLTMSSNLREQVVTPSGYTFPGTNSQDKLISDKDIAGIRSFVVNPTLGLGADVELGRGVYATPALTLECPLMNYTRTSSWKVWGFGMQIGLLFSTNTY